MDKKLHAILRRLANAERNIVVARKALRDIAEQEPAPAPEPEPEPEPDREPKPRPEPTKPSRRGREALNLPGVELEPVGRDGLARVTVTSHGTVIRGVVNAFAGTRSVPVDGRPLPPGYARWRIEEMGRFPDPGTATERGLENARRHRVQLTDYSGTLIAGQNDANAPGGSGIYHESDWAVGCREGLEDALLLCLGWANRMGIWRWDRMAYDDGRIEPHRWSPNFPGIDQTRTFPAHDYYGVTKLGPYSQLDHSHLNRWTHMARVAALHGFAFGELCVRSIAEDVVACWVTANKNDTKVTQFHWWSCEGIERFTPDHIGTPHAGRHFAGALQGIAAALQIPNLADHDGRAWDRYRNAVKRLLSYSRRMIDEQREVIYVIRHLTESGLPSHTYQHKRQEHFGNTIPEGLTPDIYKGFEHSLVYLGFRRLAELDWFEFDDVARDCALVLARRYPENNHELEVVEHPEWSSPKSATWDDLISGLASREVADATADYNAPWWSDHPFNSYTGAPLL